ncbi:MAG: DEAD/DEAH box helicase family protein [Methylotenera sp.]|nr:DEAD/DEAH box helicase family protein [Methylotenera sp.]
MALTLKKYQDDALNALQSFFVDCLSRGAKAAFEAATSLPYHDRLVGVPSVCLRVPTGGGKTLIAAHSIGKVAEAYANTDAPVVLWLVPSDMIRQQTIKALADVAHPYRQALAEKYGDRVKVCDLDNLQTVNRHDVGRSCIVIVTTIQAFRISKTEKRNVYAFFEELSPHFANLPAHLEAGLEKVTEQTLAEQPYLTQADLGRVKHSLANWFALHNPIVIVDEAQNTRSKLSFETFARLKPACLIELTATPRDNNVLYSVSAAELKTAQMIKLPVVLTEHPDGWQACLRDALLQRKKLELEAQQEVEYIRPILLVQAQPKGGEATTDVVRAHLIAHEHISEAEIAIATGAVKELEGINLFARDCQIRVVITVEALKEGWDCSFAYVLASLQSMQSAIDVEQLLGRVLRMPYAKSRQREDLNKAYAHVIADNVAQAAANLKDRMVENMGFNKWEADLAVQPDLGLDAPIQTGYVTPTAPALTIALSHVPDITFYAPEVRQAIAIYETSQGATVVIAKGTDHDTFKQIEASIVTNAPTKQQATTQLAFDDARASRQASLAPENWLQQFALVPQLCLDFDGDWQLVDKETIEDAYDWNLLDFEVQLANFNITETAHSFEIDMKGESVSYKHIDAAQLAFDHITTATTENELVEWLDKKARRTGLTQAQLRAYLLKLVAHLVHDKKFSLTALVRAQFQLARAVNAEINRIFELARKQAFQGELFNKMSVAPIATAFNQFEFKTGVYPVRKPYRGSYEFAKHFYTAIDDLKEKTSTGKVSEEFECAQAIDLNPNVKYWVRNIPQQRLTSFWLPTSSDYFYPDFIVELNDGTIALIEYKGEPYKTNDDSREKNLVGELWTKGGEGKRLYLMAVSKDDCGRSVLQQVNELFS